MIAPIAVVSTLAAGCTVPDGPGPRRHQDPKMGRLAYRCWSEAAQQGYVGEVGMPVLARLRRVRRRGPFGCSRSGRGPLWVVFGLVGYGVVHLLVAWLALQVAIGVPGVSADAQGAVGTLARTRFGGLARGAAGLAAFALWQLTAAAVGFRWVSGGERARKRAGAIAKAITMLGLAGVVVHYLLGRRQEAGDARAVAVSADLLALPAGRGLLGVAAVVILALAGGMVYTGLRCTFMGGVLDVRRMSPVMRRLITVIGAIGHLARAVALAVVGCSSRVPPSSPTRGGRVGSMRHSAWSARRGRGRCCWSW